LYDFVTVVRKLYIFPLDALWKDGYRGVDETEIGDLTDLK